MWIGHRKEIRWPIHIINPVDETKVILLYFPPTRHHSFVGNLPLYSLWCTLYDLLSKSIYALRPTSYSLRSTISPPSPSTLYVLPATLFDLRSTIHDLPTTLQAHPRSTLYILPATHSTIYHLPSKPIYVELPMKVN